MDNILEIQNLKLIILLNQEFSKTNSICKSLTIFLLQLKGQTFGLVGESDVVSRHLVNQLFDWKI